MCKIQFLGYEFKALNTSHKGNSMAYQVIPQACAIEYELPLLREVTVHSDKVSKTAHELFGTQHEYLTKKLEFKKKLEYGAAFIPATSIPVTCGLFIASYVTQDDNLFLGAMYSMMGGAITIFAPLSMDKFYGFVANEFMLGAEAATAFSNSFENFKSDPEEYKAIQLFVAFGRLNGKWLEYVQNQHLLQKDQIDFFRSTGTIFLMDAICEILKEKKTESSLVKNWNEVKLLNPHSESYINFWKGAGLVNPLSEAHSQFGVLSSYINSIDIATRVNQLFLAALTRGIDLKYI